MKFPLYIAKRYLFSRGSTQAINIITAIAAVGIVVGALSLFVVLSAFDGLKSLHLEHTSIADPDVKVSPAQGKFFDITETQKQQIAKLDGVVSFSSIVENQVILNFKQKRQNATIKGVDANYPKVIAVDSILDYGDWIGDKDFYVVLGNQISNALSLGINNYETPLDLVMPKAGKGQITNLLEAFKTEKVVVSGIYQLTNEMDQKYVFTHINLARGLLNLDKNKVSHIELRLSSQANYGYIRTRLEEIFGSTIIVKSRIQLNDAMYKMLNTENLIVYLLFTLVLIVALFSLIGAMIMMIIDKKRNLQTLHKLGASLKKIRLIFFLQGMLMTILGGLLGVFLGVILIQIQQASGLVMITPTLAYPTQLSFLNGIIVLATLYVLGVIASSIASLSIKKEILVD
ncbi:ABC transporter permease [Aquimarina agarilytica]|uniref:ABC transporter permease n=1 Tax=Aquimarina agarilytica TaxID=1087449 RepID=UPI0002883C91|nr:ABC transporter permease [Aquimarina agarilytica]